MYREDCDQGCHTTRNRDGRTQLELARALASANSLGQFLSLFWWRQICAKDGTTVRWSTYMVGEISQCGLSLWVIVTNYLSGCFSLPFLLKRSREFVNVQRKEKKIDQLRSLYKPGVLVPPGPRRWEQLEPLLLLSWERQALVNITTAVLLLRYYTCSNYLGSRDFRSNHRPWCEQPLHTP